MGRKAAIAALAAAFLVVAGTVGAYAWDAADDERIVDGVTIGGVDVGGMNRAEAAERVTAVLVRPLRKPVRVRHEDERFRLKPKQLGIRADLDGMVNRAFEASREGGIVGRTWRRLVGGTVEHEVEPRIDYDRDAVSRFVDRVGDELDREPVDAKVDPTGGSLEPVLHQDGQAVDRKALRRAVNRALQRRGGRRTIDADVETVEPEVTTAALAESYPTFIIVDRPNFRLRFYENLELSKTYTVAIGRIGNDTPTGQYSITNKAVNPAWHVPNSDWAGELAGRVIPPGPDNPIKARWMGVYDGVGIHGTDDQGSLGQAASRGCIRMSIPEVEELYEMVPVGTPIYIR